MFKGNASKHYLFQVKENMQKACELNSKNPLEGSPSTPDAPIPNISPRNNYMTNDNIDESYVLGVGKPSNIVMDQDIYEDVLDVLNRTDNEVSQRINEILDNVIRMCQEDYIVPATNKKYLSLIEKTRSTLSEFNSLTQDTITESRRYIDDISNIDNSKI